MSDPVTHLDLATFEVDDNILLQHKYAMLLGLENRKQQTSNTEQSQKANRAIQSVEEQRQKVQTWFKETAKPTNNAKTITAKKDKQKFRA